MNSKKLNIILLVVVIVLLGVVTYVGLRNGNRQEDTNSQNNSSNETVGETSSSPTTTEQANNPASVYESQFLKVSVPAGWSANQAVKTTYNGTVPQMSGDPAAVNITKGDYVLFINTKASQASGVTGGRFSEIAMGAPSADAVITSHPSDESLCGKKESHSISEKYTRVDLFTRPDAEREFCNLPKTGNAWYFSYVTTSKGGYFNYYNDDGGVGLVITMANVSKDVDKLPTKDNSALNTALEEMSEIVKTLEVK